MRSSEAREPELDAVIRLVERLASVAVCVSSVESLSGPGQFKDTELLSWRVSRLRRRWTSSGPVSGAFDAVFSYPAVLLFIGLRLVAAVTLCVAPLNKAARTLVTAWLAVSSLGLAIKNSYAQDGSDQMSSLTFTSLALEKLLPRDSFGREACVIFIALQACLSYLVAGLAKAVSPAWRSGDALYGIFRTTAYGDRRVYAFLRKRPKMTRWAARLGVLGESSFPLVLIVPKPFRSLFLLGGALFHGACALFMGLNRFIWAFVATYPTIMYCADRLQRWRDA